MGYLSFSIRNRFMIRILRNLLFLYREVRIFQTTSFKIGTDPHSTRVYTLIHYDNIE